MINESDEVTAFGIVMRWLRSLRVDCTSAYLLRSKYKELK